MAKTMYDPWSKIITRNGYAGDEVISALQKSIRRSLEEQACMFAYEMYISSPELLEKMWRRLLTISVEDIGMGDPMAAVLVNNLYQIIYVFLTIFLYLLKCPQSLILSALRAFCFCGKPHISRSIFLYFRYQTWLKSW